MIDIVCITNDSRMIELCTGFSSHAGVRLLVADDFDDGLRLVFEKLPEAVLVQSRIGAITAETVARHIKTLFRNEAPRMVVLQEQSDAHPVAKELYDESLCLDVADVALREAFMALVERIARPFRTESLVQSRATNVADALETHTVGQQDIPAGVDVPSAVVNVDAAFETVPPPPGEPQFEFDDGVLVTTIPLMEAEREEPTSVVEPDPSPMEPASAAASLDEPLPDFLGVGKTGFASPRRRWQPAAALAGVVLVVGASWLVFRSPGTVSTAKGTALPVAVAAVPAAVQPVHVRQQLPLTDADGLPGFIPRGGLDPTYSKTHPGWVRYRSETIDYHLFRQGERILALQVVGRVPGAMGDAVLADLLRKTCGTDRVSITSESISGGYRIQNGVVAAAEIAMYRKGTERTCRAIVLTFS